LTVREAFRVPGVPPVKVRRFKVANRRGAIGRAILDPFDGANVERVERLARVEGFAPATRERNQQRPESKQAERFTCGANHGDTVTSRR